MQSKQTFSDLRARASAGVSSRESLDSEEMYEFLKWGGKFYSLVLGNWVRVPGGALFAPQALGGVLNRAFSLGAFGLLQSGVPSGGLFGGFAIC